MIQKITTLKGLGTIVRVKGRTLNDIVEELEKFGGRLMNPLEEYHVRIRTQGKEDCGSEKEYPSKQIDEYTEREIYSYGSYTSFLLDVYGNELRIRNPAEDTTTTIPAKDFSITRKRYWKILKFLFGKEAEKFYCFNGGSPIRFGSKPPTETDKPLNLYFGKPEKKDDIQFVFDDHQDTTTYFRKYSRGLIPEGTAIPHELKEMLAKPILWKGKDVICYRFVEGV